MQLYHNTCTSTDAHLIFSEWTEPIVSIDAQFQVTFSAYDQSVELEIGLKQDGR